MFGAPYYHGSVRRYVIAFGSLFNAVEIVQPNGKITKVPIIFATKEKFITKHIYSGTDGVDDHQATFKNMLPAMGYELTTFDYDSSRKTNTYNKFIKGHQHTFNRVPYNFGFRLTIATRKFDDGLRIVEQILPFFTPGIYLEINDMDIIDEVSTIVVDLDNIDYEIDAFGTMEERRSIVWTLDFTLQGWLYKDIKAIKLIKKNIIEFMDARNCEFIEGIFQYVDPLDAADLESAECVTEIESHPHYSFLSLGDHGHSLTISLT